MVCRPSHQSIINSIDRTCIRTSKYYCGYCLSEVGINVRKRILPAIKDPHNYIQLASGTSNWGERKIKIRAVLYLRRLLVYFHFQYISSISVSSGSQLICYCNHLIILWSLLSNCRLAHCTARSNYSPGSSAGNSYKKS